VATRQGGWTGATTSRERSLARTSSASRALHHGDVVDRPYHDRWKLAQFIVVAFGANVG